MLRGIRPLWRQSGGRAAISHARRATTTKKIHQARLALESLEDRLVPTISFLPTQGLLTETPDSVNAGMTSPPVYLLFWGSYWGTQQGVAQENQFINDVKTVVGSSYLRGLVQYGSDGKATFGAAVTDTSNPPPSFDMSDVNAEVQRATSLGGGLPPPAYTGGDPIYFVVTDPNAITGGDLKGAIGYNQLGQLYPGYVGGQKENVHLGWVGNWWTSSAHNAVDRDNFTTTFSHELAEAMTYSDSGLGINVQDQYGNSGQIADFEAEAGTYGYAYRLGGVLVQAYWSVRDGRYIVPDGNVQEFALSPIWNNGNFTNTYNLTLNGDQLGVDYSDQISLARSANTSGVQATVNNESATFDSGAIKTVNVNTFGGQNSVNVDSVPAGVAVKIGSTGNPAGSTTSNDFVQIGNGSLSGIAGTVNISNGSGQTTVFIDDANDTARNITVTDHSVAFAGLTTITYQAGYKTTDGSTHGVIGLGFVDGQKGGPNQVDVESVPSLTPVSLFSDLPDNVYGPAAGQLHRYHW
jgi:hypothetical protein